ncbi:hypothetical protein [Bdellovibrio sp. HCB2-146]|uniref:hypothetical protein n=1 Tax=Bdellovibrio sp. HCB2-146 TaxID=3394362 RepID=UPI0039BD82D3
MKLLIPVLLLFASSAQALEADRFECKVTLKDYETNQVVEQVQEFDMARQSLSASPSPDVRMTAARTTMQASLERKDTIVKTNIAFYYKHAVKLDATGKPVDARQFACVGISLGKCTKHGSPKCGDSDTPQVICKEPRDPFDSATGWTPTKLIDGVPMFTDRGSGDATAETTDGTSRVVTIFSCKYKGTYW